MEQLTDTKPGTKERIMDAAEYLFGERGFGETSLREITARAGANLAAVNYHFQSKDALIQAVFARRLGPINEARIRMLDEIEARAGQGPLDIEDVLRAFVIPVLSGRTEVPAAFKRMFGRAFAEPGNLFFRILREQFGHIKQRFLKAVVRAMPGFTAQDLFWKLHFTIGAMAHTLAGLRTLEVISDGVVTTPDPDEAAERLVKFLSAGFRVPETPVRGGSWSARV
jgi:AcrR family transcriptional regulator